MKRHDSVAGTDKEALTTLLALHAVPNPRILDCTYNRGRIWRGLEIEVHRLDIDPGLHSEGYTDTVADFRALPFPDASWDVLVFDPPHITDAGDGIVGEKLWGERFGTRGDDLRAENVGHFFRPFLQQAQRVLVPKTGIVLAKIANMVHSGRYQDQARRFKNEAEALGFTHCDEGLCITYSRGGLIDPRWEHIFHLRGVHSFWIVLRNGRACMSPHAPSVVREETAPMFAEERVA